MNKAQRAERDARAASRQKFNKKDESPANEENTAKKKPKGKRK